jgi:hypothetical protein
MDNKKLLEKLVKIAANQQKILEKLAQYEELSNEERAADEFIKTMTAAWLANNLVAARYRVSLRKDGDNYKVFFKLAPLPGKVIADDVPAKYQTYMAKKMLDQPFLADKKVGFDIQVVKEL